MRSRIMKVFFSALVCCAGLVAGGSESTWRMSWSEHGHEVMGEAFLATPQDARARLAWANSVQPQVPRKLVEMPEVDERAQRRLFTISVAAAIAANALDVFSSYNKPELNPVLQPSGGRFGTRSVLIKSGLIGGLQAYQLWEVHRNPHYRRMATWTNFIMAGAMSAIAAHNFTVRVH